MSAGRSAAVTGAAFGIGRATAQRLASYGLRILAFDRDLEGLERTAGLIAGMGGEVACHEGDLRDEETSEHVVAEVIAATAPAAPLNVADVGVARTIIDTTPEEWGPRARGQPERVYRICGRVLSAMIAAGGEVVVNVASVARKVGVANRAAYCASKAGVVG